MNVVIEMLLILVYRLMFKKITYTSALLSVTYLLANSIIGVDKINKK